MRNLHITMTPFRNESRLLKQARTLVESAQVSTVLIIALWEEGLAHREKVNDHIDVIRLRLWTRHLGRNLIVQMLKYFELMIRAIWIAGRHRVHIVNCHALALLPLGAAVRFLVRARLVYDPHELETERAGLAGFRKSLSRIVERSLIGLCDHTFVVGNKIKADYCARYPFTRVTTVMNCPYMPGDIQRQDLFRTNFDISKGDTIFLYQGLLDEGRGLETIIDAFASSNADAAMRHSHLVIMGYGPLEKNVKMASEAHERIHFHPSVPPSDVLRHTASADVGLCLIEPICLSYAYSLPNKFFEYLSCGLHVVCSDLPEVRLHGAKLAHVSLLESPTAASLAEACKTVMERLKQVDDRPSLPVQYSWEYQGKVMLAAYEQDVFPRVRMR